VGLKIARHRGGYACHRIRWPGAPLTLAILTILSSRLAQAGCSTDTAASDFAAGTLGSCYVAQVDNGEVVLAPTEGSEFSGVALPAGWNSFTWDPSGTVTLGVAPSPWTRRSRGPMPTGGLHTPGESELGG